ncbi:unnamed protein product, partial [Prorocentrum cordatum]
ALGHDLPAGGPGERRWLCGTAPRRPVAGRCELRRGRRQLPRRARLRPGQLLLPRR